MKVAAIIPAYNEEKTIGGVLDALRDVRLVDEIIVVSDGSTDRTVSVAGQYQNITLVELPKNLGKAAALIEGVKCTEAEILLFLDADLVGLTSKHVELLLRPLISGAADMTRAYFTNGRRTTDLSHKIVPGISGQRAIRREIIEGIPNFNRIRFGVEVALNRYVKKKKLRLKKVELMNVTHRLKEEKYGFRRGFQARIKMYWDILEYLGNPRKKYKK